MQIGNAEIPVRRVVAGQDSQTGLDGSIADS